MAHPDTLTSLNNLAALLEAEGRFEEAEALYSNAIVAARTALSPNSPRLASLLNNYGLLLMAEAKSEAAVEQFDQALAIQAGCLGPDDARTADTLSNLAIVQWALDKPQKGCELLNRANAIYERALSLLMDTGAERQKDASAAFARLELNLAVSLHLRSLPDYSEAQHLAARLVLQRKGRLLEATARPLQLLRRNSDCAEAKLLTDLREIRTQRAVLSFDPPPIGGEVSRAALLQELQQKEESLEVAIGDLGRQLQARFRSVEIGDVCSALPAKTALIEYVRYFPFQVNSDTSRNRWGAPRYAAYLFQTGGLVAHKDLGSASEIENSVTQLLYALGHPDESDYRPLARDGFGHLLAPFLRALKPLKHLVVSPDGLLNLVPFAVLVTPDNRHLVEKMNVSYLSSGRDLARSRASQVASQPPTILADPDYGPSDEGKVRYPRLEYSAREAELIRELLPNAQVLAREDASKENLFRVESPVLLHLATHGEVQEDPSDRPPVFGPRSHSAERLAGRIGQSPLLRSWLALAGANAGHKSGGVVTALELTGLNMLGTELVVASACKTGLGQVQDGEGVYGLRRAFMLAGARSLLISLWSVGDESTFQLMTRFYRRLLAGTAGVEAICEAQREFLRDADLRHPFFWSGFVFFGDFDPKIGNTYPAHNH